MSKEIQTKEDKELIRETRDKLIRELDEMENRYLYGEYDTTKERDLDIES
jgi:hypothetical protein